MTFFRSEEHLRSWAQFNTDKLGGIISLPDLVTIFSGSYFKRRMDADYVSRMQEYASEMAPILPSLKNAGAFWKV
jgi:hypothetical protein